MLVMEYLYLFIIIIIDYLHGCEISIHFMGLSFQSLGYLLLDLKLTIIIWS